MTIEELRDSGEVGRGTESAWLTTVSALGAGIAIGVVFMWSIGPQPTPTPLASSLASATAQESRSPQSPRPTPVSAPIFPQTLHASVRQPMNVDDVAFSFTVPADGWARYDSLYISKSSDESQRAEAMIFWAHFPAGLYARTCYPQWDTVFATTTAQVAEGLATGVPGTELVAGPTDVTVGGLAAKRVVLFVRDDNSCGPGLFYTWDGEDSRRGPLWEGNLLGDTLTAWTFEIAGERFIIASETHLDAGAELEAEVRQIIDSIEFEPVGVLLPEISCVESLTTDVRHQTNVDGASFSFSAPAADWCRYDDLYLSKDSSGSQAAEAMVAWTRFPDGEYARACDWSGDRPTGSTAADLGASFATGVPGTDLVEGPTEVTLGGIAAHRVVLSVADLSACGRGYFFTWRGGQGGPFWGPPALGDTITIWVVDLAEAPFIVATETHRNALPWVLDEVQQIVDSIQFEQ